MHAENKRNLSQKIKTVYTYLAHNFQHHFLIESVLQTLDLVTNGMTLHVGCGQNEAAQHECRKDDSCSNYFGNFHGICLTHFVSLKRISRNKVKMEIVRACNSEVYCKT